MKTGPKPFRISEYSLEVKTMTNRKVLVSQYDLKDYKGMAGLVELLKISTSSGVKSCFSPLISLSNRA